ncbi:hypothetical protein ACTFIY_010774 [Dictyostelium cf. discoideum]
MHPVMNHLILISQPIIIGIPSTSLIGSEYFTSLTFEHYQGPSFQLDFECNTFNGTVCYSQINQENKKQLYGTSITYTIENTFDLYKNCLPTPIVSSPFRPPTKGGISILRDATNVNVNCPPGCGYQIIKWENGKLFNFRYSNPSVADYKINPSNIILNGSDFCDNNLKPSKTIKPPLLYGTEIIINGSGLKTISFPTDVTLLVSIFINDLVVLLGIINYN